MSLRLVNGRLVKRAPLPVTSCDGCSACCMYQGRPPFDGVPDGLPEAVRAELAAFDAEVTAGIRPEPGRLARKIRAGIIPSSPFFDPADIEPCLWLDATTHRCKHHEHRPEACREFEVGGRDCLTTRAEFRVPLPLV